jgi:hypothetical protein
MEPASVVGSGDSEEVESMVRRTILAAMLALTLALSVTGIATALTANISPPSQNHAHGVHSSWTMSWNGVTPYRTVCFYYDKFNIGEGYWCIANTNYNAASDSHTYYPCTTTNFTQLLNVTDWNSNFKSATSNARENGGNPC